MLRRGLVRAGPFVLLLLPVLVGLAGTVWPALQDGAFGRLAAWPGLHRAALLSLGTGLVATLLALVLTLLIVACLTDRPLFRWIERSLSPLLAVPHAAAALGLAFLIAPSGWVARALSPWATGWQQPPDLLILNDPLGLSLTFGLVLKELPFLLIVALAALPQTDMRRHMQLARSFGYSDVAGFFLTVLPALYPQMRLPVLAVLTYAMTNVDMAQILGPTTPPTLALQITRWMTEPGLRHNDLAAAAALLQLGLVLAALLLWRLGEGLSATLCQGLTLRGYRLSRLDLTRPVIAAVAAGLVGLMTLAIAGLALWSVAGLWPFPATLPQNLTASAWSSAAPALTATAATTVLIAVAATGATLALTLSWLQAEDRLAMPQAAPLLIYLPLIVPQIGFLPGLESAALRFGAQGGVASVTAAHLIFVLPYLYLTLSGPFRAWDQRLGKVAATLGASNPRIFWQLRLPMVLVPILTACAVGFAVSIAQYLPTLLVGGGRVTTLTTEALALASGGNRRLTSAYAVLQTLLPIAGFVVASWLPRWLHHRRFGEGNA